MADPIAAISTNVRPIAPIATGGASAPEGPAFADTLKNLIGEVANTQKAAGDASQTYATGRTTDVTATMVAVERASISFALMLQVRNRLLDAYQEIQRIQV
jgi:flagellar hook-basal body complex protein FliE